MRRRARPAWLFPALVAVGVTLYAAAVLVLLAAAVLTYEPGPMWRTP